MEAETKYAKSGDVHIAYRVVGSGPRDVILVPGTVSHVELYWQLPANAYLLERLARFARVIMFDKRGQGLSDRVANLSLDERVDDLRAVMEATGSRRAAIYGWSEGGQLSLTFAAAHPERVSHLVLYGSYASIDVPREGYDAFVEAMVRHWGTGVLVGVNAPSRRTDAAFVEWFGGLERAVASPGTIRTLMRANYAIDVRHLLPAIRVPTLILHRVGDALVPVAAGRLLANAIPGAKYVELPGDDHLLQAFEQPLLERLIDEIERFVCGTDGRPQAGEPAVASQAANDVSASAIAELERYREILTAGRDPEVLAGVVARAHAIVAAARGSWTEAEARFLEAAETFRRHGMVWQEAHTLQSWGHALQGGPDRRSANEKLERARAMLGRPGTSPAADGHPNNGRDETAPSSRGVFRREGDYWTIASGGRVMRLRDSKGLHYIAYLLGHPGREIFVGVLADLGMTGGRRPRSAAGSDVAGDLGDAGPILDASAREQYRRRIRELDGELAEAIQGNDLGRSAHLRAELDALREQVATAVGLGGRARRAASHTERVRLMVTKAIKAAVAKIRTSDASLGRHLATSIKTGSCCLYDPGPSPSVAWDL